ncbi:hypothetical protein Verru16b_02028 [Lacunisphaera limnophila]|uniref:Glycosyltransferase RgtA/B/C/D-like domain-containing protein n=1 Tax=Lacunisphaera limnophila TaxID=1838286 RepID=A0A1D8AVN8_9BACT|nr:hypothetical protein [Lacunisphaera limnophila]AOS44959.1 hypothetical protein Verru16b_02028 [Lacunisphaera limnophila]
MTETPRRLSPLAWCLLAVAMIAALLPWWRNHNYLRDLYDYGLVLASNGHLDRGERPYVDYTTPIQAGFLGLNWLIERAGGGTYAALTRGGAALIAVASLVLTLMLARRWPWWAALIVGTAVTVASASQHTILWHNTLGVCALALVSWAAACAPVVRRVTWPWHLLAGVGLFLGGINKLNFHLVALTAAVAWAVRAGCRRQAGWGRVGVTVLAAGVAGVGLPLAVELAWTGASLQVWLANVVQVAAGSRLGLLKDVWSVHFLLRPIHEYYGELHLPQVGLMGALLSVMGLAGCWPRRAAVEGWDRLFVPVAVAGTAAAGAALLATNFEIAYVGLAAWLVLVTSLWLGFAGPDRRAVFVAGLILPAVVIGGTAWWSAWTGQRSQFGFSDAPRADYVPAENAGAAFAPLRGLRLPPDLMLSLELFEGTLPDPDPQGRRPVFYGAGLEFVDRFYPARARKGEPLWFHWGTSYGPPELARLGRELARDDLYEAVFILQAYDVWPPELRPVLEQHYVKDLIGPRVRRWNRQYGYKVNLADTLETLAQLGGNVDGRMLHLQRQPLGIRRTTDGRLLLGTTRAAGHVLLRAPSYRFGGKAVLDRLPGAGDGPLSADVKVIVHGAIPEEVRWSGRLELPAGQQSVTVPFLADGHGKQLLVWITRPEEMAGRVLAGVRDLEITHAFEQLGEAPRLRDDVPADSPADPELGTSLFGPIAWRPQQLVVRGGWATAGGLALPPGGELWLHTEGMTGEVSGQLVCADVAGTPPAVRVLWYKGGRVQILQQGWLSRDQPFAFRVWTAEPGGWIGVMVEPTAGAAPAVARVLNSTLIP